MKSPNEKAPKKEKKTGSRKTCAETSCRVTAVSNGYCRLHYLANWKTIKLSQQIKAERRLNSFVDRLSKKYPKDFLEKIKEGLGDEEKFNQTMEELDIEMSKENPETDNEFLERFMRIVKPE